MVTSGEFVRPWSHQNARIARNLIFRDEPQPQKLVKGEGAQEGNRNLYLPSIAGAITIHRLVLPLPSPARRVHRRRRRCVAVVDIVVAVAAVAAVVAAVTVDIAIVIAAVVNVVVPH